MLVGGLAANGGIIVDQRQLLMVLSLLIMMVLHHLKVQLLLLFQRLESLHRVGRHVLVSCGGEPTGRGCQLVDILQLLWQILEMIGTSLAEHHHFVLLLPSRGGILVRVVASILVAESASSGSARQEQTLPRVVQLLAAISEPDSLMLRRWWNWVVLLDLVVDLGPGPL